MTGRYLALEGIEGAGKSTVSFRIADLLRGRGVEVVTVREPGGTPAGERIRRVLLDEGSHLGDWTEALLFAASRAQLAAEVVGPALAQGAWVLTDRSVYSSLAYQGGGRRLGIDAVRALNEPGLNGVWPQLVALLRLDPSTGLQRQEDPDRIGGEGLEFQTRVAGAFDEIAAREPDRFVVVDATAPLEDVVARLWKEIEVRWLP
jgi:dTMP kinase